MEPSVTKRVAKNFSWLSIGEIFSRGLQFMTIVYIARVLGAASFGLLSFAQAFLAYLVLLVDSGLSLFGAREIAREKEKAGVLALNIFAIRILVALILFALSFVVLNFLPLSFEMRLLFIGTFLFIFYRALNTDWAFQGLEKMEQIAISRVLYSGLYFILVILLIRSSGDLVKVPFLAFASGIIVSIIFLTILFKLFVSLRIKHLSPVNWFEYYSDALPLGVSIILIQIYCSLDTIMLGFMDKVEVVGYYNAAYKMFLLFSVMLGLWQSTAFPVVSKRFRQKKERALEFLNRYAKLTLFAVIPTAILVTFLSPLMIDLIFGAEYVHSVIALQILIWNIIFIAVSGIYGILIMVPLGKNRQFLWGVGSGAIINVILNLILIPLYSYVGAAIATLLSEALVVMVMCLLVRNHVQISIIRKMRVPVLAVLVSSLSFLLILWPGAVIFKIITSAILFSVIYLAIIFILGERDFFQEIYREIVRAEE